MGDLNSRTGIQNEIYTECDSDVLPNLPRKSKFWNIPLRKNCDEKEDTHGKKVITFCKTFDLIILNGRTKGDPCGNYTHVNFNNGPSSIDYGLCNKMAHAFVDNFLVLPMTELSDHAKIVTIFKEKDFENKKMEVIIIIGSQGDFYMNGILEISAIFIINLCPVKGKLKK